MIIIIIIIMITEQKIYIYHFIKLLDPSNKILWKFGM